MTQYKTTWWHFSAYRIVEGKIVPGVGAILESYDPWEEFYASAGRYRTVETAWGELVETVRRIEELKKEGAPPELRDDAILQWTQRYGLLGLLPGLALRIEMPLHVSKYPSGKELFRKQYFVESVGVWDKLGTVGMWRSLGEEERRELLNSAPPQVLWRIGLETESTYAVVLRHFSEAIAPHEIPVPLSDEFWRVYQEPTDEWVEQANTFAGFIRSVSKYAREKFDGQKPSRHEEMQARNALAMLDWHACLEANHHFFGPFVMERRRSASSLFSVLANMFLLDLEARRRLITCTTCQRFFVSNDARAKYCRVPCRNLAQTQRYRFAKKHKERG